MAERTVRREAVVDSPPARSARTSIPTGDDRIMNLQRSIGNAAVLELLRQQAGAGDVGEVAHPVDVGEAGSTRPALLGGPSATAMGPVE